MRYVADNRRDDAGLNPKWFPGSAQNHGVGFAEGISTVPTAEAESAVWG
ncbi:MAG: hypothetical protein ACKV22_00150 [Bryobacteraceae bacterium]